MSNLALLDRHRQAISQVAREFGVAELCVFGSILRDDFRPDSDIDFLVEFQPQLRPGLFTLIRLQHRLADLLGRRVDLVPKAASNPPSALRSSLLRAVTGRAEPVG